MVTAQSSKGAPSAPAWLLFSFCKFTNMFPKNYYYTLNSLPKDLILILDTVPVGYSTGISQDHYMYNISYQAYTGNLELIPNQQV